MSALVSSPSNAWVALMTFLTIVTHPRTEYVKALESHNSLKQPILCFYFLKPSQVSIGYTVHYKPLKKYLLSSLLCLFFWKLNTPGFCPAILQMIQLLILHILDNSPLITLIQKAGPLWLLSSLGTASVLTFITVVNQHMSTDGVWNQIIFIKPNVSR